ncbi:MAG TPA: phosphoribosylglycinamide formyltransferase [Ignavibacteria bacterium]
MKFSIGVFGSGRGSNFKSVLDKIKEGYLESEIKVVISNNSNAGILEIARLNNIPSYHISIKQFNSENEFNQKILDVLEKHSVDFILLAGYMKKIDSNIVNKYKNRILNIHPALIPSFCGQGMYGLNVHKAVLDYGCKITGVTVHLVNEEYDNGPIVLQKPVEVNDDDTPEELADRVLKEEHKLIIEAIRLFEEERLIVKGRKVIRRK